MKKNKNKNIVLRKSKSAQKKEEEDQQTKSQMHREPPDIKTQLSKPEFDGEIDSAIGSEVGSVRSISFEDDNLLNDDLFKDLDNLTLNPNSEKPGQSQNLQTQQGLEFNGRTSGINTGPPDSVDPKFPVPSTTAPHTGYSTGQKAKFQHNRIRPDCKVQASRAYQQLCYNTNTSEEQTDGEQPTMLALTTNATLTTKLPPSFGSAASSLLTSSGGGMSDFVILHTDDDIEDAFNFKTHLLKDSGTDDLKVDLFSNIDAGKPKMKSLSTLHENYRYILTFVTSNLESDRYSRFLEEILITLGLKKANGKEDRVVPVFTKAQSECNIPEIIPLTGLLYYKIHSSNNMYLESVRKLVQTGRTMFP